MVVALHGCTQSAADYYAHSGWPELADRWRFEVVFPQQSTANNSLKCFNWFSTADDTRGNGEAASVKSMVDKAIADHGSDRSRVFVTGLSAGGGMTADLLAAYPDVFAGGGINAGLPAQCATSVTQATNCQQNNQNLTPAQWAAKVKAQYPGYTGAWPRVAIWQGTGDYTVYPVNGTELRDQWTAVHGLSQTPSSTQNLPGGTTLTTYGDKVQLYSIAGMGHGTAVDPGTGATQCGSTGAYFLAGICSSYYTGRVLRAGQGIGDDDHAAGDHHHDDVHPAVGRLRERQQLRPHPGGPRAPEQRPDLRQRLQPGDGAVEHLHHARTARDVHGLLGARRRAVLTRAVPARAVPAHRKIGIGLRSS